MKILQPQSPQCKNKHSLTLGSEQHWKIFLLNRVIMGILTRYDYYHGTEQIRYYRYSCANIFYERLNDWQMNKILGKIYHK